MFADTYIPQWVQVDTESGEIEALAFTSIMEHEHNLPPMPLEETAKLVFQARDIAEPAWTMFGTR